MSVRRLDVAPARAVHLPESGLGRGWEAAVLFCATAVLIAGGLVVLYSASSVLAMRQELPDTYYVLRQASGAAAGLLVLAVCAWLPYRVWAHLAWPLLGVTVTALVLVVLPWTHGIAPEVNGARRWLRVGVTFQPSELAKVSVVIWTAMLAVRKAPHFRSMSRGMLPFLVVWGVVVALIAIEPDLSTAFLVTMVAALVVFCAGGRIAHFGFVALAAIPFVREQIAVGFRADRLAAFSNPLSDPTGAGFQVRQSLVALGSGGVSGVGIGEGRQKFGFLPEAHNDFIFAMIGEEWGLLGVLLLVLLYGTVVLVGFRVAGRAPDAFGELLAVGLTSLIALQALLHMAVGLALVPATGLSLPLVSYGRSNLLATCAAVGILISVARSSSRAQTSGVQTKQGRARA
ncbi:MAG: FtsW/RodA/SpoVE family cell cycle protein [Gemmatimonadota bacterium]|nr:FtsW/RodA/SpoVE family cell cycle protein [Gemmatimonadota bacterium]